MRHTPVHILYGKSQSFVEFNSHAELCLKFSYIHICAKPLWKQIQVIPMFGIFLTGWRHNLVIAVDFAFEKGSSST